MDADGILVDLQGMQDFRDNLTSRLQQAASVLATLAHTDGPQLGSFYHAQQTEERYDELCGDYLDRVRRLILALAVSDATIGSILDAYQARGQDNAAWLKTAADVLTNDGAARAAVRSDPAIAEILRQDPQLNQVLVAGSSGDTAGSGVVGDGTAGG